MIIIPNIIEKFVPFNKILEVVESLKLENYERIKLFGKQHQLIFSDIESGSPIEYSQSTQLSGFDIYIWESLKEKGKDKLIFVLVHELAEISIRYLELDSICAHRIALLYEKKLLSNLSRESQNELSTFADELRKKYPKQQEH